MKLPPRNQKAQRRSGTKAKISFSLVRLVHWPTLLTILISVSGWGFVYLLESLVASPLVEYEVQWESTDKNKRIGVSIENLSRTTRIKRLVVGFASRDIQPGQFSNASMKAVAPAAEGVESAVKIVSEGEEVQFEIMDLQPRRRFQLEALYSGTDNPELRLLGSQDAVYLYKGGILTKLAKFSIEIIGLLTMLFLALLVVALFVQVPSDN